jgi:hypothetical protein
LSVESRVKTVSEAAKGTRFPDSAAVQIAFADKLVKAL